METVDHSFNLPHKFEYCPECEKKGYYRANGYNRCKYCGHMVLDKRVREEFDKRNQ